MNAIEKQMVSVLEQLRKDHGITEVKASLEAEGILLNELLRTNDITMAAGVGLSIKIGGCEALTRRPARQGIWRPHPDVADDRVAFRPRKVPGDGRVSVSPRRTDGYEILHQHRNA